MEKRIVNLCMSGGRTSAYMVEQVLHLNQEGCFWDTDTRFIITFANTGREHEKTLEFVKNCSERWAKLYVNSVVWLEAVVHADRLPCSHKVVDFNSACRDGAVFEAVTAKYGLPNGTFLHCTRELKENPIMSYMESIGESKGRIVNKQLVRASYETWIGIREDEPKRLGGNKNGKQLKFYPLAERIKVDNIKIHSDFQYDPYESIKCDKQDVLDFWEDMPFDLDLPEHLGNCIDCHKKSNKKLNMVYNDMGIDAFKFTAYLDNQYSEVKAQILEGKLIPRKRFRGYLNTKELIGVFESTEVDTKDRSEESGGCSESCEPFMMDNTAE